MALVFESQKRRINWFALIAGLFLIGFLAAAAYYLFFAPVPKIQAIIPVVLEETNLLSELEFIDPTTILNNPNFRRLKQHVQPPGAGTFGRTNPFLPF